MSGHIAEKGAGVAMSLSKGRIAEKDARPPHICRTCWAGDHSHHRPELGGICIGCTCVTPPAECNGMCVMDESGYAVEHPHPGCPAHATRPTSPGDGRARTG